MSQVFSVSLRHNSSKMDWPNWSFFTCNRSSSLHFLKAFSVSWRDSKTSFWARICWFRFLLASLLVFLRAALRSNQLIELPEDFCEQRLEFSFWPTTILHRLQRAAPQPASLSPNVVNDPGFFGETILRPEFEHIEIGQVPTISTSSNRDWRGRRLV